MVAVLASEVWTLRERLLAIEALQVQQGGLSAGEVDAFEFSADDDGNLAIQRKEFIDSLFRVLAEQVDEAERTVSVSRKTSPKVKTRTRKTARKK